MRFGLFHRWSVGIAVATIAMTAATADACNKCRQRRCRGNRIVCQPACPTDCAAPESAPSTPTTPSEPTAEPEPSDMTDDLGFDQFAALSDTSVALVDANGGYLDNAVIRNRFRLRFDNGSGINQPSRAEYFYAKCGCFRTGIPAGAPNHDPNAFGPGPNLDVEGLGGVDYQEYQGYLELAPVDWISGFVEMGIRSINPELNDNTSGLSDMRAGFKMYLYRQNDRYLTFQLRTYIPTGDSDRGLGTNHVSLEPGVLFYRRIGERIGLEAEFKDWISVGGTNFAGNVLQYGGGIGYDVYRCRGWTVTPTLEMVGWTVLTGRQTDITTTTLSSSASGDFIVNVKPGVRVRRNKHSLYAGYGRALTGDVWYQDIFRVEYRLDF